MDYYCYRLIKGDGEILEEIVSKEKHREINRQATLGDGLYFQSKLQGAKKWRHLTQVLDSVHDLHFDVHSFCFFFWFASSPRSVTVNSQINRNVERFEA